MMMMMMIMMMTSDEKDNDNVGDDDGRMMMLTRMRLSLYIQILYPCILVRMGDFQEKLGQS